MSGIGHRRGGGRSARQRARGLQDRRLPPLVDRRGHRGDPAARQRANDFTVDVVDGAMTAGPSDPQLAAAFTDANLAQYDVVVFLSTTGDILTVPMQEAFERYIQGGGGYAGVHAASDTEYTWPWYGQLVGGYFRSHPPGTPTADVDIDRRRRALHRPASRPPGRARTSGTTSRTSAEPVVNGSATVADFSPRASQVHVLATVDESSYDEQDGNTVDDDHPVAWCSDFDGGRSWYTAMGHTEASFADADFRATCSAACRPPPASTPTAASRARPRRPPRTSRRSRSTTTRTRRWRSTSPTTGACSTSSSTAACRCGARRRGPPRRSARSPCRSSTRTG